MHNTRDVDILIRRADLDRVHKRPLERAGFVYRHSAGIDLFLDANGASDARGTSISSSQGRWSARMNRPPIPTFPNLKRPKIFECLVSRP